MLLHNIASFDNESEINQDYKSEYFKYLRFFCGITDNLL